jgi:membrane associated rhomboid family serine protease
MNSFGFGSSEEHQPVTWWRGHPVYAAHFIVVMFVASMLLTTLMLFARVGSYLEWLEFSSGAVLRGQVWRVVTYGFVNAPSLGFALDMLMIVWFGREVERSFGRQRFFFLYGGVYLVKPVLFTALGLWMPRSFAGEVGSFALFVAFATLFPSAPLLFNILAKWAALGLVGISTLMALAAHDWVALLELWGTCGFAFVFVRHQQGLLSLPTLRLPGRRPKLRVLPDLPPAKGPPAAPGKMDPMADADALLDKIAKSGIRSLTAAERAKLEAARADLLKRDPKRR